MIKRLLEQLLALRDSRPACYCFRLNYFLLLTLLILGWSGQVRGQDSTTPVRLPATPNAAALERYALMPVNEAAGTPSISLPLYEVHSGALVLPLTLSYHASGIRVVDRASWAGLGWVLNAGGVITCQVRGLPDEHPNGFSHTYQQVPQRNKVSIAQNESLLQDVVDSHVDYQPDLYSYNFQGQAGSFMLGNDGSYHCLPLQPVRIQQAKDLSFLLTDAHGVSYWFAHQEQSYSTGRPPASIRYTSAWYLSRVVSADKADTIRLEYDSYQVSSSSLQQQHSLIASIVQITSGGYLDRSPPETYSETLTITYQATWRLRRVIFRGGEVRFSTASRLDLPDDRRLTGLTVLAGGQDTLKHLRFYHSYFDNRDRLRLDSVATTASRLTLPPYHFTYNTISLPDYLSGSRDHWGYYNGAPPVSSFKQPVTTALLIPRLLVTRSGRKTIYPGADRAPNPAYVQAGLLTAITYPTGGSQHFTYEPNTIAEQYPLPPTVLPTRTLTTNGPGPTSTPSGRCEQVQDTLLVTHTGTWLHYTLRGQRFDPLDNVHDQVSLRVYNAASTARLVYNKTSTFSDPNDLYSLEVADSVELPLGRYTLVVQSCGNTHAGATIIPTYTSPGKVQMGWRNTLAGGVRLRELRIQPTAQGPATIKRYRYTTPGTILSSGYAIGSTLFMYDRSHISRVMGRLACEDCPASYPPPAFDITYVTLSSSPLTELSGSDRPVGYRYVTVVDSATTGQLNGYTVSRYAALADEGGGWIPARPLVSNAWQRDQLLEQRTYASQPAGSARLLAMTQHDYAKRDSLEFISFTVSRDADLQYDPGAMAAQDGLFKYAYENARQTSGWLYLRQTRQYQYAPGDTASSRLTTTTYHYDNPVHQQPTLVETDLPGGQHQLVRSRYVADFDTTQVTATSPPAAQALRELTRLHAIAQLVENTTLRTTPTDTLVTQSQLTLARRLAPGVVVPDQHLALRTAVPLPGRNFAARLQGGALRYNARYEPRLFFDRYTADRQPAQTHVAGGPPTSYLWDPYAGQPLAQANAPLTRLAATSFELGASGQWSYDQYLGPGQHLVENAGRTGRWAYQLTSDRPVSRDSLPAGDYILTCWYQGSQPPLVLGATGTPLGSFQAMSPMVGNWQAGQVRLHLVKSGAVQVSAPTGSTAVLVDELTLRPVGAQVTTYTYDALRGMSSQTDPTGRTIFYEYDELGRLLRTRDEQGRILSQQQYHYAQH
jgi:YD repeat-containing protein